MSPIEPRAMRDFFADPLPVEELYEEAIAAWNRSSQRDPLARTLEFYTTIYLQNDILTKVDRAAMMVSLESRAVFLDNDLVDFCRRLPNRWKLRHGVRKYILRRALTGLVPDEVLSRKKQGFGVPIATWLRHVAFPGDAAAIPGLNHEAIRSSWRQHYGQQTDQRFLLWTWLVLQTWSSARNTGAALAAS
jgi:asparagine synthase (glutamine-hydrolysing)